MTSAVETETEVLGLADQPARPTYKLQLSKRLYLKGLRWEMTEQIIQHPPFTSAQMHTFTCLHKTWASPCTAHICIHEHTHTTPQPEFMHAHTLHSHAYMHTHALHTHTYTIALLLLLLPAVWEA